MATLVPIPKLGQSEETVTLVKWHKDEGDFVKKGDVLLEVETDKAVLEVESQFEGTLLKKALAEGTEVPVMSICGVIGEQGEEIPEIPKPKPAVATEQPPTASPAKPPAAAPAAASSAAREAAPSPAPQAPPSPSAEPGPSRRPVESASSAPPRQPISPRARAFAQNHLIDVEQVPGSGPQGRVIENDVRQYLEASGYNAKRITPTAFTLARKAELNLLDIEGTGVNGRVTAADVRRAEAEKPRPMSRLRRTIASRLTQAKQTIPHFYVSTRVDMTSVLALRKSLKEQGVVIGVNDFIMKAVIDALTELPVVNAVTEDGETVRMRTRVHLGIAVNRDDGLVVPVIRKADTLDLDELHAEAGELIDKARSGKASPDELRGSTFTISNMGMMNVEQFSAIIQPNESAILAVSSAIPTPVVSEDREIVVRDMMNINLSADHRVIDGVLGATFVNTVKRNLENASAWQQRVAALT